MNAQAAQTLPESKLICHKCPIPDLQNCIDPMIDKTSGDLLLAFWHRGRLRQRLHSALGYLLMGAPNWRTYGQIGARKIGAYLWPFAGQQVNSKQ